MKVVYLGVIKTNGKGDTFELCNEVHVEHIIRYYRPKFSEMVAFSTRTIVENTTLNGEDDIGVPLLENQDYVAYVRNSISSGGISVVAVTDLEYPPRVARALTLKIREQFLAKFPRSAYENATKGSAPLKYPELKDLITEYQNPEQADPLMKLQKELDDTVFVMHKSINSVLQRGEKIDDLVAKSEDLSTQSKMFYTQAKKQNSCCVVM